MEENGLLSQSPLEEHLKMWEIALEHWEKKMMRKE